MTDDLREIYCCGCEREVQARLTNGYEIYPNRQDLGYLPFWKCDDCGNYVGCHHKTINRTQPLGNIPTPELRNARQHIHKILDPLWAGKKGNRTKIYNKIADAIGKRQYHTANIRTVEEARQVYRIVKQLGDRS